MSKIEKGASIVTIAFFNQSLHEILVVVSGCEVDGAIGLEEGSEFLSMERAVVVLLVESFTHEFQECKAGPGLLHQLCVWGMEQRKVYILIEIESLPNHKE